MSSRPAPTVEVDVAVIGGGVLGTAVAARLSRTTASVCLLEAGPPDAVDEIHLPAGCLALGQSKYDWALLSDPEPGFDGRRVFMCPRYGGSDAFGSNC